MGLGNNLRVIFARALITLVHYAWRAAEKGLRKRFPVKEHYLIMNVFRGLARRYPVTIQYPNPIATNGQTITLRLDLCQNSQDWYFRLRDTYELEWLQSIDLAMQSAQTFVDVGAHLGVYSLPIAQAYPECQVLAIEPMLSNFESLESNVRLNHLSNIEPVNAAVSEDSGPVFFYANPLNDGGGSLLKSLDYRTGDVRISADDYQRRHPGFCPESVVETRQLNKLIIRPSVVKIDVEGAEVSVLKSGMDTLKNGLVDLLVVEVIKDTISQVINLLDEAEFDCFFQGQRTPITDPSLLNRGLGNILCLRRNSQIYERALATVPAA